MEDSEKDAPNKDFSIQRMIEEDGIVAVFSYLQM
jgi:hypothetical protein